LAAITSGTATGSARSWVGVIPFVFSMLLLTSGVAATQHSCKTRNGSTEKQHAGNSTSLQRRHGNSGSVDSA
jgi:hypothetical protein